MSSPASPAASVGRRLTRRAIDLLVVAFLITVGLSVGRQLVDWWRTDPESLTPDFSGLTAVDLDWSRTPVTLRFGESSTAMERRPFQGRREQLEEELTRIGQSLVSASQVPTQPMDEAERGWLEALESAPPVFWDSSLGNVYRRREPLPSFVATRFVEGNGQHDESVKQRIVGWGLGFPTATGAWTIYVFHPASAKSSVDTKASTFELPPGARNITDLQGADGCQWHIVQGRGDMNGWVQHFENQFGNNFTISKSVSPQLTSLKYRRDRTLIDIQIRRESDDRLTAVVWSAPERNSP